MLAMLAHNWWALALRGVAAIAFGILALVWPGLTLAVLVLLFGAYVLVDGVFAVIAGITSHGRSDRWWAVLLEGLAGVVIGVLTFLWPGITALILLYFIAAWALVTGVLEIVTAIQLRRLITGEWAMILGGVASIVFGALLFVFPGTGALTLVWLIGAYSLVFGVLLLVLALRLRGMRHEGEAEAASGF